MSYKRQLNFINTKQDKPFSATQIFVKDTKLCGLGSVWSTTDKFSTKFIGEFLGLKFWRISTCTVNRFYT